ncbi:Tautomerase/MIF superfamily [Pseudomassariella vexata]|uniref:L-dopachrome isomerase n=1 Tax=Pseudomassariella vexata TaxID=1141098 RepID=A0A1Y2EF26_9PEZI|nr:Tautomerase/MIF superfamily [Pseudomassariella vexata]ORY69914.1 Tautomerase/MIF superfamily [Pseudomassariella vexata]
MQSSPKPRVQSPLPLKSPASPPPLPKPASPGSSALSFAQRKAQLSRPSKSKLNIVEGNKMLRNIDRPPPGDPMSHRRKSQIGPDMAKRKSAYFEGEFAAATREMEPGKDRIRNEAIVMAEFRTNVIIQDEFTFITDFSYHLSNRYQRPLSSVCINVQHSSCIMFGGSFEPAYTLTIFALPCSVQPITNKRNAALIQNHIQEFLGVPPSRGYVRFVATPEDSVACGGKTVAGELDELDRDETSVELDRSKSTKSIKATSKSKRMLSVRSFRQLPNDEPQSIPTPPSSADDGPMITSSIPEHPTPLLSPERDQYPSFEAMPRIEDMPHVDDRKQKVATRRRSFVTALFSSRGTVKERRPKTANPGQ